MEGKTIMYVEPCCKVVELKSQGVLCNSIEAPDFTMGWTLEGDN